MALIVTRQRLQYPEDWRDETKVDSERQRMS